MAPRKSETRDKSLFPVIRLTDIEPKLRQSRKRKSSEMSSCNGDAESDKSSLPGLLTPRSTPSPSPAVDSDDEPIIKKKKETKSTTEEYEIEKIVGYHIEEKENAPNEIWYLIKWKGYSKAHNTWEQVENLTKCNQLLMNFFDGARAPANDFREIDTEIKNSLPEYEIYQKLEDSGYIPKYLNEFSENHLDLTPLFKNRSIESFIEETKKQYDYVVKTLYGMALHRDYRMFKRAQDYKILLNICEVRKKQLRQLLKVQQDINNKEKCLITVENTVDLELFPKDLEYITESRPGKDVQVPTDPLTGCDCQHGCNIKSNCCGTMSSSEFAYNVHGKLRLPEHSAIYECNSHCKCDKNCPNRVVQHGRKIKLGIFKTEACGWGVKALEKIPKGTFICEYVGELIKDSEAVVRDISYFKQGISYLFDLDFNDVEDPDLLHCIDATTCGNVARFINHSCDPNLTVFPVWINCMDPNLPRLAFFSKRQINRNEEINFDYESMDGAEKDSEDDERNIRVISKIKCECRSAKCRQWVFGNK